MHLGIKSHLVVSDEEGIALKAYENDGVPFPRDDDGGVEAQRLCREWAARAVFGSSDRFSLHYQYTDTPAGSYFCFTYLEPEPGSHAVTFGVGFDDARLFRGRETENRRVSGCPDHQCCRIPAGSMAGQWSGKVVAPPRAHARIVGLLSPDPFPSIDLAEIYGVVDRHQNSNSPNATARQPTRRKPAPAQTTPRQATRRRATPRQANIGGKASKEKA